MTQFRLSKAGSVQLYRSQYVIGAAAAVKKWGGQLVQADANYAAFFNNPQPKQPKYIIWVDDVSTGLGVEYPTGAVNALSPTHGLVKAENGRDKQQHQYHVRVQGDSTLYSRFAKKGDKALVSSTADAIAVCQNPRSPTHFVVVGEVKLPVFGMTNAFDLLKALASCNKFGCIQSAEPEQKPAQIRKIQL